MRLEQSKWSSQEPDPNTNATTIASPATRGLIHSLPTEPSGHALRSETSGWGTSGRGTLQRMSPPADSPISCWSTSTSQVFPAATACHRICTARRGFCSVSCQKSSNLLSGWVSAIWNHGRDSGVCCPETDAGGWSHRVCSHISLPCSNTTTG